MSTPPPDEWEGSIGAQEGWIHTPGTFSPMTVSLDTVVTEKTGLSAKHKNLDQYKDYLRYKFRFSPESFTEEEFEDLELIGLRWAETSETKLMFRDDGTPYFWVTTSGHWEAELGFNDRSPGEQAADWARDYYRNNVGRFNVFSAVMGGYAHCNQFLAACYAHGAGVEWPTVPERPIQFQAVTTTELAGKGTGLAVLSWSQDYGDVRIGTAVIWHGDGHHHSAIVTDYSSNGDPIVTFAGAGDLPWNPNISGMNQVPLSDMNRMMLPTLPIYRNWIGP